MCQAYSNMRDLDENPYSPEEAKAAKYLMELTGIGGGDDPVGFLISSPFFALLQGLARRCKNTHNSFYICCL
jgi:hypothetical protein